MRYTWRMNEEKQVWLAAYCAALTAIVSVNKTDTTGRIHKLCKDAADCAVDDYNQTWHAGEARPPLRTPL